MNNINYIILIVLAFILTRAFLLNFFQKHLASGIFRFFTSVLRPKSGKIPLRKLIVLILLNRKSLIIFILKSVVISVLIVMFLRSNVSMLFMVNNGNYISNGLILILPLPIGSYIINIVLKIIKKQTISTEDYYLFNKYVVNNINIYRISYILSINYIVKNYYYMYISLVFTITILVLILGLIYLYINGKLGREPDKLSTHMAGGGQFLATVSAFIALTPVMQDACNKGYADYVNNKDRVDNHTYWRTLPFEEPGRYYMGEKTVNFTWTRHPLMARNRELLFKQYPMFCEHQSRLENSPILNMTYNIKNHDYTYRTKRNWEIKPVSFFSNDKFYGSVSETKWEKLLIIVIIRKDMKSSNFYPSYYLPDNTTEGQKRGQELSNVLVSKYNLLLPTGVNSRAGYMVFTQGEPVNDSGLIRVWRPAFTYLEPEWLKHETRVRDYFKVYESNMIRRKVFNYKDYVNTIKKCASINAIDEIKEGPNRAVTKRLITNEVRADRTCRLMYQAFLLHGAHVRNPDEYRSFDESEMRENEYDPDSFNTIEELMEDVDDRRINEERQIKTIKSVETTYERNMRHAANLESSLLSNHITVLDNCQLLFARRNIPKDLSVFIANNGVWNWFHVAQQGVIEGFKSQGNGLGKFNCEFELPFSDSRKTMISSIGRKYNTLDQATKSEIKTINAVCINRLSFEFIELRPNNNKDRNFGYIPDSGKEPGVEHIENPVEEDFEIFSIYDSNNEECVYDLELKDQYMDAILPKHDYHFLDNKDEHSIRKLMDYIYQNKDEDPGHLCYQSDIANSEEELEWIDLSDRMGKFTLYDQEWSVKVGEYKVDKNLSDYNQKMIKRKGDIFWPFKIYRLATLGLNPRVADKEWEDLEFEYPSDQGEDNVGYLDVNTLPSEDQIAAEHIQAELLQEELTQVPQAGVLQVEPLQVEPLQNEVLQLGGREPLQNQVLQYGGLEESLQNQVLQPAMQHQVIQPPLQYQVLQPPVEYQQPAMQYPVLELPLEYQVIQPPLQYQVLQEPLNYGGLQGGELLQYGGWEPLQYQGVLQESLSYGLQGLDYQGGLQMEPLSYGLQGLDYGGLHYGGLQQGGLHYGGLQQQLQQGDLQYGGLQQQLQQGGLQYGGLHHGGWEPLHYQGVLQEPLNYGLQGEPLQNQGLLREPLQNPGVLQQEPLQAQDYSESQPESSRKRYNDTDLPLSRAEKRARSEEERRTRIKELRKWIESIYRIGYMSSTTMHQEDTTHTMESESGGHLPAEVDTPVRPVTPEIIEVDSPVRPFIPGLSFDEQIERNAYDPMTIDEDIYSADG